MINGYAAKASRLKAGRQLGGLTKPTLVRCPSTRSFRQCSTTDFPAMTEFCLARRAALRVAQFAPPPAPSMLKGA